MFGHQLGHQEIYLRVSKLSLILHNNKKKTFKTLDYYLMNYVIFDILNVQSHMNLILFKKLTFQNKLYTISMRLFKLQFKNYFLKLITKRFEIQEFVIIDVQ